MVRLERGAQTVLTPELVSPLGIVIRAHSYDCWAEMSPPGTSRVCEWKRTCWPLLRSSNTPYEHTQRSGHSGPWAFGLW